MTRVRQWLNQHPAMASLLLAVVLLGSVGVATLRGGRDIPTQQWFYDLGTGELFAADGNLLAPIDAPSGPAKGLEAAVFSCGDCGDSAQRFIGYFVFYTDYYKQAITMMRQSMDKDGTRATVSNEEGALGGGGGIMVRRVDDEQWYSMNSNQGAEIAVAPYDRCEGEIEPRRCYPD